MARLALLALAVAAVVLAAVREHEDRGCRAGQRDAVRLGVGGSVSRGLDPAAVTSRLEQYCTGGATLAAAATGLLRGGKLDEAENLVRTATDRDPDDVRTWRATVAVKQAQGDRAGAERAQRRALMLSPPRPAPR